MVDYKLWGSENALAESLGTLTQGLGHSLVPVDKLSGESGVGDVLGPPSASDNALARFDGPTGKLIQDSSTTLTDAGALGVPEVVVSGSAAYDDTASMGVDPEAFACKEYVDARVLVKRISLLAITDVPQSPTDVDTPIVVAVGPAQTTADLSLDATGVVTVLESDSYNVYARLTFGRGTTGNQVVLFAQPYINGVAFGSPIPAKIDSANVTVSTTIAFTLPLDVGDTLWLELVRDSSGDNDGGLVSLLSQLWGQSDCVFLEWSRNFLENTF